MANITLTPADVDLVYPHSSLNEIINVTLDETVTEGQALYLTAGGDYGLCDTNAAGEQQFRGIALAAGFAGNHISMLKRGWVYGATLAGAYDSLIYASDTPGAWDDGAGTLTVIMGRVVPMNDVALTKVAYIESRWPYVWA